MTKRKHAELIKAWADGAVIEYYNVGNDEWYTAYNPAWVDNNQYRIKDKFTELKEAHQQGKIIEYYDNFKDKWFEIHFPAWMDNMEYRVKPEHQPSYLWATPDGRVSCNLLSEELKIKKGVFKDYTIKLLWSETYL